MDGYKFRLYCTMPNPVPGELDFLKSFTNIAKIAEYYGYEGGLIYYNHKVLDPWILATRIITETKTFTPLIALQPYTMPPFTTAKMIYTLQYLYGRKVDLNVITGAVPSELSQVGEAVDHDQRYQRASEYIEVLKKLLLTTDPLFHNGEYFSYNGLVIDTNIKTINFPRILIAGSSVSGMEVAKAIGNVAITHPEPFEIFSQTFLPSIKPPLEMGIRIGIIARPDSDSAWNYAYNKFPQNRISTIKTMYKTKSESTWNRKLASIAVESEVFDSVYWTGAYRSAQTSLPMLVGSYAQVKSYLEKYLEAGVNTIILGSVHSDEEFRHINNVISLLR